MTASLKPDKRRGATPGPWHYQDGADAYTHIVRGQGNAFVNQFSQDTTGRAEADARLTAAAWDMLASLREMLALYEVFAGEDECDRETDDAPLCGAPICRAAGCAVDKAARARAAIRKAEGR